tara:strand:+ start:313 stop:624 length:312 start_codon:yes stop_codon:yes gene_type:complete
MKKIIVFFLVLFLIITTSIIKNSTKDIDDEIYLIRENLLLLEKRYKNSKLEYDYLSSSEKLLEYQKIHFENLLKKKVLKEIKTINIIDKEIFINNLTMTVTNE